MTIFDNSNKKFWDRVWKNDSYSNEHLRILKAKTKINILLKHISPDRNWNVIDLGCGGGYVSEELYRRISCNITAVDFSDSAIKTASKRLRELPIKIVNANVCQTNQPEEMFDLVICSGILEHVPNKELFINEVTRLLKPGGHFFVTSSNKLSLLYPHRLLKQFLGSWRYGYQKNYTPKQLKKLFNDQGLQPTYDGTLVTLGDFQLIGLIDNVLNKISSKWGRYTVLIGRKIDNGFVR